MMGQVKYSLPEPTLILCVYGILIIYPYTGDKLADNLLGNYMLAKSD